MSKEPLRLYPQSGLCSRLRAIIGAMAQAETEGRDLEVVWNWRSGALLGTQMPLQFSDIWQTPFRILDVPPLGEPYLETCHLEPFRKFIQNGQFRGQFRRLRLTPEVASRMLPILAALPAKPIIGVHIRSVERHSVMARLGWFQERLRNIRRADPECQFYLMTDSRAASEKIHHEFDPGVCEQWKTYQYDQEGALASVADLYVLIDYCDRVIGTNCSASSQVVALARGATYRGPSHRPGGVSGGSYEDAWNPNKPSEPEG